MRKIVVTENLTLDGVMQAPNGQNEDTRGGFTHGGWAMPFEDEVKGKEMAKEIAKKRPILFGRRTYEHLYQSWHGRTDNNPFTKVLDNAEKYVVSRTLREPLPWENSTLLNGDAAEEVKRLKEESGKDIVVLGSGKLVRSLMEHHLIDEYLLLIHPVVVGQGQRLFPEQGEFESLEVVDSVTTPKGVVIATYRHANGMDRE